MGAHARFRGHFSTKSRAYSTTLGALRQARADHRTAHTRERLGVQAEEETTLVVAHWFYAGQGYTPSEAALAAALTPSPKKEGEPPCPGC